MRAAKCNRCCKMQRAFMGEATMRGNERSLLGFRCCVRKLAGPSCLPLLESLGPPVELPRQTADANAIVPFGDLQGCEKKG